MRVSEASNGIDARLSCVAELRCEEDSPPPPPIWRWPPCFSGAGSPPLRGDRRLPRHWGGSCSWRSRSGSRKCKVLRERHRKPGETLIRPGKQPMPQPATRGQCLQTRYPCASASIARPQPRSGNRPRMPSRDGRTPAKTAFSAVISARTARGKSCRPAPAGSARRCGRGSIPKPAAASRSGRRDWP